MRIVQISDIHITMAKLAPNGVNVQERFLEALKAAQDYQPDLLLLSGDLAIDLGGIEIYRWICKVLDEHRLPYLVLAGNHDVFAQMREVFDWPVSVPSGEHLYFRWEHPSGENFLVLDSSAKQVSEEQLAWLDRTVRHSGKSYTLVLHHPITMVGNAFLDYYCLKNQSRVFALVQELKEIKTILTGHYHYIHDTLLNSQRFLLCPSTYFQVVLEDGAMLDRTDIYGFRYIEIEGGIVQSTKVHWL